MKIISGGQTGVDRAALDVAIACGISYGGWCPKGGLAEDLPEPPGLLALYPNLRETPEADSKQRTQWNVRDSDRLLVLTDRAGLSVSKGTGFAVDCADGLGRAYFVADLVGRDGVTQTMRWLRNQQDLSALCVAGPRESEVPGIYAQTRAFLGDVLAKWR